MFGLREGRSGVTAGWSFVGSAGVSEIFDEYVPPFVELPEPNAVAYGGRARNGRPRPLDSLPSSIA